MQVLELILKPERGAADVWVVPISADRGLVSELRQALSHDEMDRALRFRAEEHRDLFVVGRAILRNLLACYIDETPEQLAFRYGSRGKPYLRDHPDLQFNLGHSGGRAVYAVAADELGVDIELKRESPDWQKISKRFFSLREIEELTNLDATKMATGFFCCWTRKEAYIKATGEGLAKPLDKFYAGAQPAQSEGAIEEEGQPQRWFFRDLIVGDDYASAIVTQFTDCRIRFLRFSAAADCLSFVRKKQ